MNFKILYIILCLLILVFGIILLVEGVQLNLVDSELDEIYNDTIFSEISIEFSELKNRTDNTSLIKNKLHIISDYIQNGFIWALNNKSFYSIDLLGAVRSDASGKKVIRFGKYKDNPYIIAYYKSGACGEHAALATFLANESNIVNRKVYDPSNYHAWIEIFYNGEWYYYDPTFKSDLNCTNNWFAPRSFRMNNSVIQNAARVFYKDEDITHYYPPYGTIYIKGLIPLDSVTLNWDNGDQIFGYKLHADDNQEIKVNVTPKKYTIVLNRLIINSIVRDYFVKNNEILEIDLSSIRSNNNFTINSEFLIDRLKEFRSITYFNS